MSELNIELISIGDEILIGQTLDTNSNWIAAWLSGAGFRLRWHSVIGDNKSDIRHQVRRALDRADVVITTGGLGPTADDITRPILTKLFKDDLLVRKDLLKMIRDRFSARKQDPPPGYEIMAEFPTRAKPILNKHGSAPGIHYSENSKELFSLPGVPLEMQEMVNCYIMPILDKKRSTLYANHIFNTTGIGETSLEKLIGDQNMLDPIEIAFLPSIEHGVTIRLSISGIESSGIRKILNEKVDYVRSKIFEHVYTENNKSLQEIILKKLENKGLKLSVAESCTGGMICSQLVSVPGSSNVLDRGFITYSNQSKIEQLQVPPEVIEKHGAVSNETAEAMAYGAVINSDSDLAISVTGIAGPTGGTLEKPIGLVYVGFSDGKKSISKEFRFNGVREANRKRSSLAALTLLWQMIK